MGFPALAGDWNGASAELIRLGGLVERVHQFHAEAAQRMEHVAALFPYGFDPRRVVFHCQVSAAHDALATTLEKEGHADAHAVRRRLEEVGEAATLPFHAAVQAFGQALGDPEVPPRAISESWRQILAEAVRLSGLRERRERLETIAAAVGASGATKWAAALTHDHAAGVDPWTPAGWRESWGLGAREWPRPRHFGPRRARGVLGATDGAGRQAARTPGRDRPAPDVHRIEAAAAEAGHPVLATVNEGASKSVSAPEADLAAEMVPATSDHEQEVVVEAGDTVIVRYADDNRVRRFRLSREGNNPDQGVVHVGQPIGVALLGNGLEEEVELVVGIIEKITKAA